MEHVREWVAEQVKSKKVNHQLVCNFDQVWTMAFRPSSKTLEADGQTDGYRRFMGLRKLRHAIELGLNLPLTEKLSGHLPACVRHSKQLNCRFAGSGNDQTFGPIS